MKRVLKQSDRMIGRVRYSCVRLSVEVSFHLRAMMWPKRNWTYRLLKQRTDCLYRLLAQAYVGDRVFPGKMRADDVGPFLACPVFICGAMKSGTTLMSRLLDGHASLVVMPGDSHFAASRDKWQRSPVEEIERYWFGRMINPSGQKPGWFLGREEEALRTFSGLLRRFLSNRENAEDVFRSVVSATALTLHGENTCRLKGWVEKTPGNERHVLNLCREFPCAKFIHIIRKPADNIASLTRLSRLRGWGKNPADWAEYLKGLWCAGLQNAKSLDSEHYRFVKYEDLVENTEDGMREIADFLSIDYDPCTVFPSEGGRGVKANSMYSRGRREGIVRKTEGKRLSEEERHDAEICDAANTLKGLYEELNKS